MLRLLLAAAFAVICGSTAHAHDRRSPENRPLQLRGGLPAPIAAYELDPIQGVGCYWARQRVLCARYCYWQPDGRRYCVTHERQARREYVPTAPMPFVEWPLK